MGDFVHNRNGLHVSASEVYCLPSTGENHLATVFPWHSVLTACKFCLDFRAFFAHSSQAEHTKATMDCSTNNCGTCYRNNVKDSKLDGLDTCLNPPTFN
eukprot:1248304-Amphidinium_carterae.1